MILREYIEKRAELKVQFDKTQQELMKYCYGKEPPLELRQRYEELRQALLSQNMRPLMEALTVDR